MYASLTSRCEKKLGVLCDLSQVLNVIPFRGSGQYPVFQIPYLRAHQHFERGGLYWQQQSRFDFHHPIAEPM
jgi:hypothetical protein